MAVRPEPPAAMCPAAYNKSHKVQLMIRVSRLAAHRATKLAESRVSNVAASRGRDSSVPPSSTRIALQVISVSTKASGCMMASVRSVSAAPNSREGCHKERTTVTGSVHVNLRIRMVVRPAAIRAT